MTNVSVILLNTPSELFRCCAQLKETDSKAYHWHTSCHCLLKNSNQEVAFDGMHIVHCDPPITGEHQNVMVS